MVIIFSFSLSVSPPFFQKQNKHNRFFEPIGKLTASLLTLLLRHHPSHFFAIMNGCTSLLSGLKSKARKTKKAPTENE